MFEIVFNTAQGMMVLGYQHLVAFFDGIRLLVVHFVHELVCAKTLAWLNFNLYTAIATIKVHLAATGALCLETLLAHKRALVHYIKE